LTNVSTTDLWGLLLYSIRYALGRQTYAVDDALEYVLRYGAALEAWQLEQIAKEIDEHMARSPHEPRDIRGAWERGAARIREMAGE
jgi:hypothetical protein